MTNPYIAQDVLDQASEAIRQGRRIEDLAAILRCSPEHLARLLNLPSLKPVPTNQDQGFDLWAADRAQEVL
jgi:hypothetical protein